MRELSEAEVDEVAGGSVRVGNGVGNDVGNGVGNKAGNHLGNGVGNDSGGVGINSNQVGQVTFNGNFIF